MYPKVLEPKLFWRSEKARWKPRAHLCMVELFLDVLEEFGDNRYRTSFTRMLGNELPKLDQLVWTIRHYARSTRLETDGIDKSEWYLRNLLPPNPADTPTSNQFGDGVLETILARGDDDPLRQELV